MSQLFIDACPEDRAYSQGVMLATPCYENPDASYTFSIQNSRQALADAGIGSAYLLLVGNCHVDDSRNAVVSEFLGSQCTDLVFLDADVSWEPRDLVKLCQFDIDDLDIVAGVYPYRRDGSTDMPVMMLSTDVEGAVYAELTEVAGLPTGFMRIRRPVLERMVEKVTHFRSKAGKEIPLIFGRSVKDGVRYGGDIAFCMQARAQGGKVYAASEIRLGHVTKSIRYGSYASALRLQQGNTLEHVVGKLRNGGFTPELLLEVCDAEAGKWGLAADVMAVAIALARKATKSILELGSGLSTVLMAAVTDQPVISLEHSKAYAWRTQEMADRCGIENIEIQVCPLHDGFYRIPDTLPQDYSFMLHDGPPRAISNRLLFIDRLPEIPQCVLFDDCDDAKYASAVKTWAKDSGRKVFPVQGRMMLVGHNDNTD